MIKNGIKLRLACVLTTLATMLTLSSTYSTYVTLGATEGTSSIFGDANGDGERSLADLVKLKKYLLSIDDTINLYGADMNCDGKVSTVDLQQLSKYFLSEQIPVKKRTYSGNSSSINVQVKFLFTSTTDVQNVMTAMPQMVEAIPKDLLDQLLNHYNDEFFAENVAFLYVIPSPNGNVCTIQSMQKDSQGYYTLNVKSTPPTDTTNIDNVQVVGVEINRKYYQGEKSKMFSINLFE